jgi:hypothetical protein
MPLKFANNQSLTSTTALPSAVPTDNLILISTQTASASANISFTTGLDSTYDEYIFKFINIHPATDNVNFQFNMSTDSGSNYNVTKTTTAFRAYHDESDTSTALGYNTSEDLAQSTSDQGLVFGLGNGNDESVSGMLQIFNPSSTTYVKHFISRCNYYYNLNYTIDYYVAGYGNTTSAINAVRFNMSSGNIDDGIIKMYGVKKS